MAKQGSLAMIPKARGMYAKRLSPAEYEELMRKRSVSEVAATLKRHPYFEESLATLSTVDPHREQLEELLSMDIFGRYTALARYEFNENSFAGYFITECEVEELVRALQILSVGAVGKYIQRMPPFLEGKLRFDLFKLAEARSFGEVLEVVRHTPYYKLLQPRMLQDPYLANFPVTEAVLVRYFYDHTMQMAAQTLDKRERETVEKLFSLEAEIYNIRLILRIKRYFANLYTPEMIRQLLVPYQYRLTKRQMEQLVVAANMAEVQVLYEQLGLERDVGTLDVDMPDTTGGRRLHTHAVRMLHFTTAPSAAMAAFITLAKLEKRNVVNVIEGVRYGMPPQKIRTLLRY